MLMRILEYVKKKCKELKAENIITVKYYHSQIRIWIFLHFMTDIFTNSTIA